MQENKAALTVCLILTTKEESTATLNRFFSHLMDKTDKLSGEHDN